MTPRCVSYARRRVWLRTPTVTLHFDHASATYYSSEGMTDELAHIFVLHLHALACHAASVRW
ncbi:MAG: hypothetical protein ACLUUF_00995 [Bifidobacterium pullorum]